MNFAKCIALCAVSIFASVTATAAADDSGSDRYESGARGKKDSKYSILHVNPIKGSNVSYYFNSGTELDTCLTRLGEKQPHKSLEIKWHNYTFVTGDLNGKTYRQADSCKWVAEKH